MIKEVKDLITIKSIEGILNLLNKLKIEDPSLIPVAYLVLQKYLITEEVFQNDTFVRKVHDILISSDALLEMDPIRLQRFIDLELDYITEHSNDGVSKSHLLRLENIFQNDKSISKYIKIKYYYLINQFNTFIKLYETLNNHGSTYWDQQIYLICYDFFSSNEDRQKAIGALKRLCELDPENLIHYQSYIAEEYSYFDKKQSEKYYKLNISLLNDIEPDVLNFDQLLRLNFMSEIGLIDEVIEQATYLLRANPKHNDLVLLYLLLKDSYLKKGDKEMSSYYDDLLIELRDR